jgi:hypothetical protein
MVAGKQMLGWTIEAPEWDWANTEKTVAPLREAMHGLDGAMQNLSPFEKAYFMEEQAALKGFQYVERELGNMAEKFENATRPMNMQLALLRQYQATRRNLGLS